MQCLLLVLALGAANAELASEDEVVVVRTSGAAPYLQAAEQLKADLTAGGCQVTVIELDTLSAGDAERFKELLSHEHLKAFTAVGSGAAQWLQARVPDKVGLCYCMVANPEDAGLTKGHCSFGVSTTVEFKAQVALMKEVLPDLKKVGMLYARKDRDSKAAMEALQRQMPEDIQLICVAVDDFASVAEAINDLLSRKPDLVWTSADTAVYSGTTVRSLLLAALRSKLPVFGFSAPFVRAGALFGVGVDPIKQGAQCSQLVLGWLAAVKAKAVAEFMKRARVEPPQYQIAINEIVAKQLEKRIPETVAQKAEVVYRE